MTTEAIDLYGIYVGREAVIGMEGQSYSVPDTYTITITQTADYPIILVGAGGAAAGSTELASGNFSSCCAGGGSGALFDGTLRLTPGEYKITVGALAGNATTFAKSDGTVLISAGGGGAGSANAYSFTATGGIGGTLNKSGAESAGIIVYESVQSGDGYQGSAVILNVYVSGAPSKYGNHYGEGQGMTGAWNGYYFYPTPIGGYNGYAYFANKQQSVSFYKYDVRGMYSVLNKEINGIRR